MHSEFPIERLLQMLRSDDPDTRRVAAVALQKRTGGKDEIYGPAVVPALLVALHDSDTRVRRPAASTLSYFLRSPTVTSTFKTALSEAFKNALSDTSPTIRQIAIVALTKIGDPSVLPELSVLWDDDDVGVHRVMLTAMQAFGPDVPFRFFVNALSDHRPSKRADSAQILGWIGDRSVVADLLMALHDEDRGVRRSVMYALVALREESAMPLLVADLVADLADQDTKIVVAAARALGELGDAAAIPGLVSALESGQSVRPARVACAEALGTIADPAAVPALLSALNDPDGLIRATATRALGDIGDPIALAPLEKLFSDHETYYDGRSLASPSRPPDKISSAAQEASARIKRAQALKTIHFSAYYPKETAPNVWQAAHVYLFGIKAVDLVAADLRALLGQQISEYRSENETGRLGVLKKTVKVKVIPRLDGFDFNPPHQLIEFCEPWHRMDFRLRASEKYARKTSNGGVSIMMNGTIVCDIPISIYVKPKWHVSLPFRRRNSQTAQETYSPYQSIFCSYSHRDAEVVKRVEQVCRALGIAYLRDSVSLRSGENWSEELLLMIERADVFQLFWSQNAAASTIVEKEWRHAYKQGREIERFIRPVYWEEPLPPPPRELAYLHFAFEPGLAARYST
jgi:HEAT repeat protein